VRLPALVLLVVLPGCGRLGFEPALAADAGVSPVPVDAPPLGGDAARALDAAVPGTLGCDGTRKPLLAEGLAGYWSFNDDTDRVTDFSATGAHGRFENLPDPVYGPGVVGTGVALDGESQAVVIDGALLSQQPLDGDFSVDAWFLTEECAELGTIIGRSGDTGPGFVLHCEGRALRFDVFNENGAYATAGATFGDPGVWHHVAALRRGSEIELHVDGVKQAKDAIAEIASAPADADVYIGRYEGGAYFAGSLDEVRLWSRALAHEEIAALHAYYRPGVIAHWSFDRDLTGEAGLPFPGADTEGVPVVADARIGAALLFDGAGQRVTFDMPEVFARTYSAEVWFRTGSTGAIQSLLNREDDRPRASIHLWVDDTKLNANVRGDDFVEIGAAVEGQFANGCWHHVVVVREGADLEPGSVKLYVDGVAGAIGTGTFGATAVETSPFVIGYRRDDDPRPFAGKIDEVRIFDRALTAEEVLGIYQIAD
jgi:hypothetical protein